MKRVAIVSARRTPVGKFGGSLKDVSAVELGRVVVEDLLKETGLKPELVDEVIVGNVLQAGLGQNVARQISIKSGIPQETPSFTINKVCGSGLKSVILGTQAILLGDAEVVIAGGTENMSASPYVVPSARWGARMGDTAMVDIMIKDGLTDAFNDVHMGITAENIADQFTITREDQDKLALASQERAAKAIQEGRFKEEIVPVSIPQRKGDPLVFDTDEFPRMDATIESLQKVRPAFKKDGSVTAANASGINDGAAFVLLMSEEKAEELGLEVLAYVKAYASGGVDPKIMGTGPITAVRNVLNKSGVKLEEIELIEANEAFAAQAQSVINELGLNPDIVNVNGGAIAIGHPIGASGTRILVTLLHEMQKRDVKTGLATLCIGGGQGVALIVER